jgi:hypothetical protein
MKRDWSRVNRERRVWTHGAERSVGFPEPLTGANAQGYSSDPRYETILSFLTDRDPALGKEFHRLHSELNQMLASAEPIDETLVQVAKTRLIRLISECH